MSSKLHSRIGARPSTTSSLCKAATLALATLVFPFAAFAQSTSGATAPGSSDADSGNRAQAYYHYMLAHEYEEMASTMGRPEYATRAIEEYKLALNDDPNSKY